MSCCGTGRPGGRLGNYCRLGNLSILPTINKCQDGLSGTMWVGSPKPLSNLTVPICCPSEEPQCPSPICCPLPTCDSPFEGGCPPLCGDSCGGFAPCCPRAAPCRPIVMFTTECPKKKCCPNLNKIQEECPPPIRWPGPPKIDMCCTTACPPRRVDICYMKVLPDAVRCFPPDYPCAAKYSTGVCCCGKNVY